jgi:hypothetical protein
MRALTQRAGDFALRSALSRRLMAPPPGAVPARRYNGAPMHPFLRNLVIGLVGLVVAGGLSALALLGEDSGLSVLAMLASSLLATAVGIFLFAQGWIWSQRAARRGYAGRSVAIALAGGVMILVAAGALAGALILVLVFYLG